MGKVTQICDVDIEQLVPYEKNAKLHDESQVKKIADSIQRFGFISPCLIDEQKNIIAGHGRVLAARSIGISSVPCVYVEGLTEEERRAYILADNKLTELGGWDMEIVEQELEWLNEMDFDVSVTGFDFTIEEDRHVEDDEYEPIPPAEPNTKKGEIFRLGRHRLMCGDSTNMEDMAALLGGGTADIVFTSPPYGASASAKIREHYVPCKANLKSFYNEYDDSIDGWAELISASFKCMQKFSSAQFVNIEMLADNKRDLIAFVYENVDELIDVLVWDKTKSIPQMQKNILNNQYEFIFAFGESGASRTMPFGDFHADVNNLFQIATGKNEYADIHKAVYPIELCDFILNKVNGNAETVLDPFGGTGTTMIAAEQSGKSCYMMELDPVYCDVIIARWEKLTGEKAELIK